MRILVGADVAANPDAGASGTVYQMNAALRRMGHEVDEIWEPDLGRWIRHGNLHYVCELPWKYLRAMEHRLRAAAYDVVELNQPHAYWAAARHRRQNRAGVFVNRSHGHEVRSEETLRPWRQRLGIPAARGPRRLASDLLWRLLERQWASIARTADGFLVSCREDADYLAGRYAVPPWRIGLVTQGVPDVLLRAPYAGFTTDRATKLLYVGQWAFFKAPMMLAQAVSLVLQRRPDVTMTWVCDRQHHAQARSLLALEVRDRVEFLGWMPQDALVDVFDRHGLFLFPSFFEGFGKTPLEAMSRGLCVVASAVGGMRDFIEDGKSGRLVPAGQPELMAAAALEILEDPELGRRMSESARSAASRHTWDRAAGEATAFYQQLLDRKARQSG